MKKLGIFVFLLVILVGKLKAQKPLTDIEQQEVTEIQLFPVVSFLNLIEKGNKPTYNDSISNASATILKHSLLGISQVPISDSIVVLDRVKYEKEVESLFLSIFKRKHITGVKTTPLIDSALSGSGKRFGLIVYSSGFSRGKGNYGKEVAKSLGVGLLTLGMYTPIPYKASSTIYVMLVDSLNHSVRFFNRSYLIDKEPLEQKIVTKQLKNIFKGFYEIPK